MGRTALVLFVLSAGRSGGLIIAVVVTLLLAAARYLTWSRFTYELQDDALVTESGVLNRTRRVVPLDRIQQVDLQRKLRHQIFGLAVVRIDTAGSGSEPEVTLDAVADAEAAHLRSVLTDRPPSPSQPPPDAGVIEDAPRRAPDDDGPLPGPGAPPPQPVDRELLTIGFGRLALGGITGSKLAVVFVALGALIGLLDDLPGAVRQQATDSLTDSTRAGAVALAVVLVAAVPIVAVVAAGAAVLTDGGFRLTRRDDLLQVSRGLLDQRQASLAVHRVQVVRINQNPLRRLLGLASVTLQSAGGSGQVEQQDTRVTIPVIGIDEVGALLAEVIPDAPALGALHPAPGAARRRAWVRRLVPALAVAAALALLVPLWGLLAVLLVPVAAAVGELAYRALGWSRVGGLVVARQGGLSLRTAVVPAAKVQSTRLTTSPLQRRSRLASLHIDVAGRGRPPLVHDAAAEDVARLHREVGETTAARRDERAVRRGVAAAVAAGVGR